MYTGAEIPSGVPPGTPREVVGRGEMPNCLFSIAAPFTLAARAAAMKIAVFILTWYLGIEGRGFEIGNT